MTMIRPSGEDDGALSAEVRRELSELGLDAIAAGIAELGEWLYPMLDIESLQSEHQALQALWAVLLDGLRTGRWPAAEYPRPDWLCGNPRDNPTDTPWHAWADWILQRVRELLRWIASEAGHDPEAMACVTHVDDGYGDLLHTITNPEGGEAWRS
jgi:hypothetical protein